MVLDARIVEKLYLSPVLQVIIVANTGRCGSTLLAQMFEAVDGELSWIIFCLMRKNCTHVHLAWPCWPY